MEKLLFLVTLTLALALPARGAATRLDWLELQPNELRADDGRSLGLDVQVTTGSSAAGSPSSQVLGNDFWRSSHGFSDSQTGDLTVVSTALHILPPFPSTSVDYTVTLTGSLLRVDAVFSIGQITSGGNAVVEILAFDAADNQLAVPGFLGQHGYNDGLNQYEGLLDWDAGNSLLRPNAANTGESGFAFFRVPGNTTSLIVNVSDSAGVPPGDVISFAVGIPEPAVATLALLGCLLGLRRRR